MAANRQLLGSTVTTRGRPRREPPIPRVAGLSGRAASRDLLREFCGSPDWSGRCPLRVPCIQENALLLVGRLDAGRADDGTSPAVASCGSGDNFGLGPALVAARYFRYAAEEQSRDQRDGRLRLVQSAMAC